MATKPALPYYTPAELLPAPLPTVAEIMAAKPHQLSAEYGIPVNRVGEHYAVRFGVMVRLQEGLNMLFVQQSSNVPVPKVYALFTADVMGLKMNFIVMEYIPGAPLATVWGKLSATDRYATTSQLRRHMDELRSIPSQGYYGGVWRGPILDRLFSKDGPTGPQPAPEPEIVGPHESEEQWVGGMLRFYDKVRGAHARDWQLERDLDFLRRHYHAVFKGHPAVFTHGDLQPCNVMLRPDGTVVIIDWEYAGWYPSFWEYGNSITALKDTAWAGWVYAVLDMFAAEACMMMFHRGRVQTWTG